MRCRTLFLSVLFATLLAGATDPLAGQADLASRGPRFLWAPAGGRAPAEANNAELLHRRVSITLYSGTLDEALKEIARQAHLELIYSEALVPAERRVTLQAQDITVAAALTEVLLGSGVDVVLLPTGQMGLVKKQAAAEPGVITGHVTNAETGEPVVNAQVAVEGTGRGTSADADGEYRIADVPPGRHTVAVTSIGYARSTQEVDVADSATVTVDFALEVSPTALAELVVTATGQQRRAELGHVVGRINADSLVKEAPVSSLSELLTGRVPGLQVFQSQGTVGGDVQLQVRTPNSLTLSGQPIVIVDGMRYANSAVLDNVRTWQRSGFQSAQTSAAYVEPTSPLNDLNPNDIETIEVVKGSSAATLYGTDASNGVIVITTKRGRPGPARLSFYARAGITQTPEIRLPKRYWAWSTQPDGTPATFNCSLQVMSSGACSQDSITVIPNPLEDPSRTIFASEPRWEYGLNVSGGRPDLRYFFGGDFEQATGPLALPPAYADSTAEARLGQLPDEQLKPNAFSKINLRSNVTASLGDRIELQGNLGYVHRANRTLSLSNPYGDLVGATPTNPYGSDPAGSFARTSTEEVDRFLLGARAEWRVTSWLLARGGVGLDLSDGTRHSLSRPGESYAGDVGEVQDDRTRQRGTSADLGLTASLRRGRVSVRTAVGAQYVRSSTEAQLAWGNTLVPGGESVSHAANRFADQMFSETVTLGSYIEETLGLNDRFFLTGAVRVDGASAFGQAYDAATYPKISASWIVSEEPFLPRLPGLDELRLRYAYGASGQQPRADMAMPTFTPQPALVEGTNTTGINVSGLGNPDLGPERVREHEFGFDATALRNRVQLGLTWYIRRTTDQIVSQTLPAGFGTMFTNLGLTTAHGVEAELSARILDSRAISWDLSVRHSSHDTRLVNLGEAAEVIASYGGLKEGYPLGASFVFAPVVGYEDADGNGVIEFDELVRDLATPIYVGPVTPPRSQSLTTVFGLFNRQVRLSALFERRSGSVRLVPNACGGQRCLALLDPATPLADQAQALASTGLPVPGDFTRLREVTAVVDLPSGLLSLLRLSSGTFSVSGRNLALWTEVHGADPESMYVGGSGSPVSIWESGLPQARSWMVRFDFGL